MSEQYVAAIDQGTASSRCMVFDRSARIVSVAQKEHRADLPAPGLGRARPRGDLAQRRGGRAGRARQRAAAAVRPRGAGHRQPARVDASSGTARRGAPVHNAINWQDTRTDHARAASWPATPARTASASAAGCRWPPTSRAPSCAGCSTPCPGLRERAEAGEVLFGTMDSWLIWKLTGRHLTDVTNASRTMLMGLETLDWDDVLLDAHGRAAGDAARDPALVGGLRRGARAAGRRARRLRARRPAGRAVRADVLLARRGQVHLRDRQLPALQHRRAAGAVGQRPADHGLLPHRRRGRRPTPWRARSRSPARSCSGSATTSR